MKSLNHLLPSIWAGLCVLNPTSSLKTKKLKSYLNPAPDPTASSFKSERLSKVIDLSSTLSLKFQILPISINKAPLSFPLILDLYSKLKAILKFASLNSFILLLLPGPNLYAFQALLSLDPPA